MKSVTVQELPQLLGTVLGWLKAGESVELREQDTRVATIQPEESARPLAGKVDRVGRTRDLAAWKKKTFGDAILTPEDSEFIRDRGDS